MTKIGKLKSAEEDKSIKRILRRYDIRRKDVIYNMTRTKITSEPRIDLVKLLTDFRKLIENENGKQQQR